MEKRRICFGVAVVVWALCVHPVTVSALGTPAYSVGYFGNGRLGGSGTVTDQWLPIPVVGIPDGIAMSVGQDHTLVLRANGTVWGWGVNDSGELGNGNTTEQWIAGQVTGLNNVTAIAACVSHSLALKSDGTVWAWGENGNGQLGNGNNTNSLTPVQVSGISTATALAGGYHSLALLSNGTVRAWGYNGYGQLGDGSTTDRNSPVQVSSLSGVIAIASSRYSSPDHSLALKNDGTVWAWGYNSHGQLGDNTTTHRSTPVQVSGLSNVVGIAAGYYHGMAVKGDGTVWTWGLNNYGQLGDGTTTQRLTPVQVSGLTGIVKVGAGFRHSLAITANGTVWAWGDNGNGRLGDGTPVSRYTPVRVLGILANAATGGQSHSAFLHKYDCNDPNPDCNSNGFHDGCDLLAGTSPDCNTNGVPDECDARGGTSLDCDGSVVPDECDNQSGNITWIGGSGGDYRLSSNWTPTGPPRGLAQAYFSNAGASDNRSILSSSFGACSAVLQASGAGKQILQVNQGATYYTGNGITVGTGGQIDLRGGTVAGGTIANSSTSIIGWGTISASVTNSGLISVTSLKDLEMTGASFTNQATGRLVANGGARVRVTGTSITQSGQFEIRTAAILGFTGALTSSTGGLITLLDGSLTASSVTNSSGANITGFGVIDAPTTNNGTMTTQADTQVLGNLTNNGTIVNMVGVLTVIGSLTNNGTIIGQPGGRTGASGLSILGDTVMSEAAALTPFTGTLEAGGDLDIAINHPARLNLTSGTVKINGSSATQPQKIEVLARNAGRDVTLPDASLFSVARLRVGPSGASARLVDNHQNSAGSTGEVLYVSQLTLDPGTTLDLAGHTIYYGTVTPVDPSAPGSGVTLTDSVGGGAPRRIAPNLSRIGHGPERINRLGTTAP